MKKLSEQQIKEQEIYIVKIKELQEKLTEEIDRFNKQVSDMWQRKVGRAAEKLNETLRDADSFREQVHAEMEEYFEERSEKWQTSEEGEKFSAWLDSWEALIDEVELEEPVPIDPPDMMDFDYEIYPEEP